ncbi:uncharacterized protein CXQ87_001180 [Candidozyma duobushaemuli]|uniref:Mid2 domain-containing protein n=2 Tax=Candidozyma TaxID=3303203 RepID=A0ABX8I2S0_9ASCO|nr:uncharacterized protein CXQ87_001180 [[Candida] duobushaemulonis]PVH18261.1 hypothetical protein CXQ87_001180 [[Candida] duobushaemulonis]QWU86815.1 hypothetical protein CA3LBN_001033 [[Candida] haemuloni]
MRLPVVLLLATLISAKPLPSRTGIIHHHHLHARDDMPGVTDTAATTSSKSTKSTSKTSTSKSSKSPSASTSDMPSASEDSSTSEMPSDSVLPSMSSTSSSSTSYSYSITVPPSTQTGSYDENPYVYRSTKPANLVFIIVGAILGLILLSLIAIYLAFWLISRSRAKKEREVYFGMQMPGLNSSQSSFFNSDGNSSIAEKSSTGWGSNSSVLMLHRQSSALHLDRASVLPSQGRSYRESQGLEGTRRGSMYISPVLEMMHGRSRSQVDLIRPDSIYGLDSSYVDSPLDSPADYASTDAINTQPIEEKKKSRPPSQVLDDLLGDMDFTLDPAKDEH